MSKGTRKNIQALIRITLTCALCCEVWLHAHWSVALSISLAAIYTELNELTRF